MKKMLILVLLFFCTLLSFSQDYNNAVDNNYKIVNLKQLTYDAYKKTILVPFLLNFLIGFGSGSFYQEDISGALSVLGFDLLGVGLIVGGIFGGRDSDQVYYFAILGGVTMGITRIFEMVLPFIHAFSYNRGLKKGIGLALGGYKPEFDINLGEKDKFGLEISLVKRY